MAIETDRTKPDPRMWLRDFQRRNLTQLRDCRFSSSDIGSELTLLIYTFPQDASDFDFIEFAIRHSWRTLGLLPTVIVADRHTNPLDSFARANRDVVELQIEPELRPGHIASMSADCIQRLHTRFQTPYCLIVQNDGIPLQNNIREFLGAWDYLGAPTVRDVPAQKLVDWFKVACLNGGFSLRSKLLCQATATRWSFFRHFIGESSHWAIDDVFYTRTACLDPTYRFRFRFPTCKTARSFAVIDFDGELDVRTLATLPLGVHGASTISQYAAFLANKWGYE